MQVFSRRCGRRQHANPRLPSVSFLCEFLASQKVKQKIVEWMFLAENTSTLGFARSWQSIGSCFKHSCTASAGAHLSTVRHKTSSENIVNPHTHFMAEWALSFFPTSLKVGECVASKYLYSASQAGLIRLRHHGMRKV